MRSRRVFIPLGFFVLLAGGLTYVESLRTEPDGRVRFEIVGPGITITAPDGTAHLDRLTLDFAPWLDMGLELPPLLGHLVDRPPVVETLLPQLFPGYREIESFGAVSAENGRDRRYLLECVPMAIENREGERRDIVLIAARGINHASRVCCVELEVTTPPGAIERRGTEITPPKWIDRWTGSPDRVIVVEFGVVDRE